MDLIRFSIRQPVVVIVGILIIFLFGALSLIKMPYQLTPTVVKPVISVSTVWPGATPYEIEREIIEKQEDVLKGLLNLKTMESTSSNSMGQITLKFEIGTDTDNAMLHITNKLNEVSSYPENVEKPVINASGESTDPVIWIMLKSMEGNDRPIRTYETYFEDNIRQRLERVDGVADVFFPGGTESQMHVIVDSNKLASHKLTISQVMNILQNANVNVSAGNLDVSRRSYRIRTVSEFKSIEDIENVVLISDGQKRVTIKDVAEVRRGYEKPNVFILHNHVEGLVMGIKPIPGTNILDMTNAMEAVVNDTNENLLKQEKLYLDWVHDQRPYINGAIDLVKQNIAIGGVLAILVLLVFLRSISSTVIVAMAIPISIIGTFIILDAMGRSLNVVSMAGISFAVGMLLDSAIVVLENIDRHRKLGQNFFNAAYEGTKEVIGAVILSVLTTVAIFIPVLSIQEEAGQLFRDIALAATTAVTISLFVSVSVIPMLSYQILRFFGKEKEHKPGAAAKFGSKVVDIIMYFVKSATQSAWRRIVTILLMTTISLYTSYKLFPPMEYLPKGNQNFVFSFLIPPPGLSYEERKEIGEFVFDQNKHLIGQDADGLPGMSDMFYVGAETFMAFGAKSLHETRAGELIPQFMKTIFSIPGMIGVSMQPGIFESGLGEGSSVDIDLSGIRMEDLASNALQMFLAIQQGLPNTQVRPIPSFEMLYPEVKLIPDRDRIIASGMSEQEFGIAVDILMDGRNISDFKPEGEESIDLVLKASEHDIQTPEELYDSQIATPQGKVVPLSSLAHLERTSGTTQIRHYERKRTITLRVTPPENMTLEEVMAAVNQKIIPGLKQQGALKNIEVSLSGTADQLTITRKALESGFVLAIIIIYLLMAALYSNFIYPLIIIFTVPLAIMGGFVGIEVLGALIAPIKLDILTMLGFIILVGIVVNNAILIVYQSINNVRQHGMEHINAVYEAVRTRLRPIYMSTLTSVFGMLPLAVAPGPGSEVYRGLGTVILGGLSLSSLFTLFVIPSLLMFVIKMEKPSCDIDERVTNKSKEL